MPIKVNRRVLAAMPLAFATATQLRRDVTGQTPSPGMPSAQIELYASQREELLQAGRALVDALLRRDDKAFADLIDNAALASLSAADTMHWLESRRIRMRWPDGNLLLDGHFDGSGTMAGFAWNKGPFQFVATSADDQSRGYPTGRWNGVLAPGSMDEPFSVTFAGEIDTLTGTIDLPERSVTGSSLSVRLAESQPIGMQVQEEALPLSPVNQVYRSEHVWDDALITFQALRGQDGGFVALATSLSDLLPPDPRLNLDPAPMKSLPVVGPLLVVWGGTTEFQNYHAANPAQRHALDLTRWEDGSTFRTDGLSNDDYLIWGESILAPASGVVVAAVNDQPDMPPAIAQGTGMSATPQSTGGPTHPAGNHVVLDLGNSTYLYLAHMQEGSVAINVGDQINAGDQLGVVGNSGHTSEPHIHLHAQSVADFFDPAAVGLPMVFEAYVGDGEAVSMGSPVQGQFVEQR